MDESTTLDHLEIPSAAVLLHSRTSLRPAPKITTALPRPSSPTNPSSSAHDRQRSNSSAGSNSPSLSSLPQFLLSTALPSGAFPPSQEQHDHTTTSTTTTTTLMSTKDPLSLPVMSANFRRFVACVGPLFYVQDRIEEIVLWKRGWSWTVMWLGLYAMACRFPQLVLCVPHLAAIAVMLGTCTYDRDGSVPPSPTTTTEGSSIPWQANLQGIQNLMGTFSDLNDLVRPHLVHLKLTVPLEEEEPMSESSSSSYTPHILTLLVLTLPPLVYIISHPLFPLRLAMFIAGAGPILLLHPWSRNVLIPTLNMLFIWIWARPVPSEALEAYLRFKARLRAWLTLVGIKHESREEEEVKILGKSRYAALKTLVQRIVDNDRLSDDCWRSDMREVELWENERYIGPPLTIPESTSGRNLASKSSVSSLASLASISSLTSSASTSGTTTTRKGSGRFRVGLAWSKANLRPTDRAGWTRRRDGCTEDSEDGGVDRLTFPLSPGWSFVESEDWRKDLSAEWAVGECGGGDEDGWVYTNEAWMDPQPSPFPAEEGKGPYVTRRRRWTRRVWFDPQMARSFRE